MADQTASQDAQAADSAAAQAANDQHSQAAGQTTNAQAADGDMVSRRELEKAQREAKNLRDRLKPFEDAHKAGMPEIDRLKTDMDALKAERDQYAREAWEGKVIAAAVKANAKYPDLIAAKIPPGTDDLPKAIAEVRKTYPDLFRSVDGDGGAGTRNGSGGNQDFNSLVRQRLGG